jgi:hypothetical protein
MMDVEAGAAVRPSVNVMVAVCDAATGDVVDSFERHNLVVDAGLAALAEGFAGSGVGHVTHFGVGTDVSPVDDSDVALGAEVFRSAVTKVTTSGGAAVVELFLTSTQANGSVLTEAGLFNGDTGDLAPNDVMFARVLHPPITKTSSITVTYRWTIAFTAA